MKKNKRIFPSFIITPINSVQEAIVRSYKHLDTSYFKDYPEFIQKIKIADTHVAQLPQKKVYLFYCPTTIKNPPRMDDYELIEFMKGYGLKPCGCAPNYLFGLIHHLSHTESWPRKLDRMAQAGKWKAESHRIYAFDPFNPWSTFRSLIGQAHPEVFSVDRQINSPGANSKKWALHASMFGFRRYWFFCKEKQVYKLMTLILAEDL